MEFPIEIALGLCRQVVSNALNIGRKLRIHDEIPTLSLAQRRVLLRTNRPFPVLRHEVQVALAGHRINGTARQHKQSE